MQLHGKVPVALLVFDKLATVQEVGAVITIARRPDVHLRCGDDRLVRQTACPWWLGEALACPAGVQRSEYSVKMKLRTRSAVVPSLESAIAI